MKKAIQLSLCAAFLSPALFAQVSTVDSLPAEQLNWYNLDPDNTKTPGVSVDRAYSELIAGKKAKKKIIVAVIDSGVDRDHEDLDGHIWTNPGEIAGNGIDDDKNGYIDDINGWNFLGNTEGEMLDVESLEMTRIVRDNEKEFGKLESGKSLSSKDKERFQMYKKAKEEMEAMTESFEEQKKSITDLNKLYEKNKRMIAADMGRDEISAEDLENYKPKSTELVTAKTMVYTLDKIGFDKIAEEALEQMNKYLDFHLNTEYDARELIGDDIHDLSDRNYGNNNVEGPSADHGTFVSSLIAADRDNSLGVEGIANNAEIMCLRAVPDGDEYDKDIALAIRYAVDNGAHIINMSFGKGYSPHKEWVDEAMMYAASKNVLLIHAAGNDSKDNDSKPSFPSDQTLSDNTVSTWMEIGASAIKGKKDLCGRFSNYGATSVDLFAPGVNVIGALPNDKYAMQNGTSFASPVSAGVAALVWSYYPELTALELKDILMKSVTYYGKKKVKVPSNAKKAPKERFRDLCVSGGVINAYRAMLLADGKELN